MATPTSAHRRPAPAWSESAAAKTNGTVAANDGRYRYPEREDRRRHNPDPSVHGRAPSEAAAGSVLSSAEHEHCDRDVDRNQVSVTHELDEAGSQIVGREKRR